jgi:putative ATP-binding cassette transporter
MAAHWRINMTKDFLDRYQKNNTSHRLQHVYNSTDNPEQRIQEDIATFTSTATSIPLGILNASLAVGAYSGMLWNMSKSIPIPFTDMHTPGWMLGVTLAITAGMTAWTYKVTKPLVVLSRMNQKLEADLRDGMGDWRKNAEAVAFLDGAGAERTALNKKFNAVMDNTYALIKRNKAIGWVQTYYGQATDFVPFILLGPAVMTGTLTYGQMIQARIAMAQVNSGMSWPLNSMDFFARLKATTDRLATLSEAMDQSIVDYEHSHPDEQDTDIAPAFAAPPAPAVQAASLPPMNMV